MRMPRVRDTSSSRGFCIINTAYWDAMFAMASTSSSCGQPSSGLGVNGRQVASNDDIADCMSIHSQAREVPHALQCIVCVQGSC